MKKYAKIFILSLISIFALTVPAFAREMLIDELGTEATNLYANDPNKDVSYIYVIGEYAFTSQHELTTQDVMLAARSINVNNKEGETNKDGIYNEMSIHTIEANVDNTGKVIGWQKVENELGTSKLGEKVNIRYIDYKFYAEKSEAEINVNVDDSNYSTYEEVLSSKLNFTTEKFYGKEKLKLQNGKLSGLLLKNKEVSLNPDDKVKYQDVNHFFAYVLEVPNANEQTEIKVTNLNGTKTITWEDFDEQSSENGRTPGVVVLVPVSYEKWQKGGENKKMTIVVDVDGENNKEYSPTTYTIDLSGLIFQGDSKVGLGLNNVSADDKKIFDKWGYDSKLNEELELTADGKLIGKLVEQDLKSDEAFGKNNKDGYYFDFTFDLPDNVDLSKVQISQLTENNIGSINKTFKQSEFDEKKDLTILFRFKPETEKADKLYYSVDLDGNEEEYLPTIYEIDCTEVKFVKESKFIISGVDKNDADNDNTESWNGWTEGEGYKTNFEVDAQDPHKVNVTGLLPIFNQEGFTDESKFPKDALYYLAFKLQTELGKTTSSNIKVEFIQEDEKTLQKENFNDEKTLYALKYIDNTDADGSEISPDKKKFTITLDWDGDEENYAPYTITVDWSGLVLQEYSKGDFGNYDIIKSEETLGKDSEEAKELSKYGFKYELDKDVSIYMNNSQEDRPAYKDGLQGKIKEQTLDQQAGFKDGNQGYFVPIKVSFPGKNVKDLEKYKKTWTLILNTEDGGTKEYTPTTKEYEQGWVLVLFKIYDGGKNNNDKCIRYKIDYDGTPTGDEETGYECLPEEYTISYEKLIFETENQITYKYRDNEGIEQTDTAVVYEGEIVDLKVLKDIETDYRKFAGWYKESENVSNIEGGFKTEKDKDVELTAHWKLNVEKFMKDVIDDLNSDKTTYSDKFDGFKLSDVQSTKQGNEITINVKNANVPLTDLAETSIPGAIAYLLEKEEIKEISLTVDGGTPEVFKKGYTADGSNTYDGSDERELLSEKGKILKTEIIKGAKDAFDEKSIKEEDATLDQLEYDNKSFTITIGSTDDTVTLIDAKGNNISEDKKTYTFKFESNFAVVNQKPDSELGAKDLQTAISSEKNYSTVYVDGDYTSNDKIDIIAGHNVTIEPVSSPEDTLTTTIKVNEGTPEYAVDVQSGDGTVTIKDLKITGGKYGELKIEKGAKVNATNIDVSGKIEESKKSDENDDMHAAIVVDGELTAKKIKNNDEKYSTPTIALVTSYSYPDKSVTGEETEKGDGSNIHPNAKVTVSDNMTKNDKYHIIKKSEGTEFDVIEETYYGSFYYANSDNSQIYFMTIIDNEIPDGAIDFFKIYNHGDSIDIETLGYTSNLESKVNPNMIFDKLTVSNTNKDITQNAKAQDVLQSHVTNKVVANYKDKPMSELNFEQVDGLSTNGNKISGTISTQDKDGKFIIPVILTSEKFQNNISTVKVTDPNNKEETYTYSSNSENTMKLELEAIKSSKITSNKGKVYEITVDLDGKDKNELKQETYTIDYNGVETLAEVINKAAEKTQNANSLTVVRDNIIKEVPSKNTTEYDKQLGRRLVKETSGKGESYTFNKKEVDSIAVATTKINVEKDIATENEDSIYLGNWRYNNSFTKIGYGVFELELLRDITANENIEAIKTIEQTEDAKTYKITVNKDRVDKWLNTNYIDFEDMEVKGSEYTLNNEVIELEVKLSDDEYISSIKTLKDFNIKGSKSESTDNKIDVTISKVENTKVESPYKIILNEDESEETIAKLKDFIEKGIEWWSKHSGSQPAN